MGRGVIMHDASVRPAVRGLRTGWIALATLMR